MERGDFVYHSEISVEEVEYALKRLKLTKAGGKMALRLNISNLVGRY